MKIVGIIPARLKSTRLPGKVLLDINGKSMIRRVWEQVKQAKLIDKIIIATDDEGVLTHCLTFGADVRLTSPNHISGTDRCAEICRSLTEFEYAINIQGDEPFIDPLQLDLVCKNLTEVKPNILTLCTPIKNEEELFADSVVKVVRNKHHQALYFSRHPIPFIRQQEKQHWLKMYPYYKHIGLYAYKISCLLSIAQLAPSSLELAESLEQLRWLENNNSIYCLETNKSSLGIDTAEDLEKARQYFKT